MAFRIPPRPLEPFVPSDERPTRVKVRRSAATKIRDERHLAFIRSLPCLLSGGPAEAAHVSYKDPDYGKTGRGIGQKEGDNWTVPLSHEHHMRQHSMGEKQFWNEVGIDPCSIAQQLWECTGDRDRALVIIASIEQRQ